MSLLSAPEQNPGRPTLPGPSKASRWLIIGMEATVLSLACLSPWVYGAVHPGFEFLLLAGVALLGALWAARMFVEGLTWQKCPVALCLMGLFLLGVWQLTPLGKPLLDTLAPATGKLYGQMLPSEAEDLPGAVQPSSVPTRLTLSLYPYATQLFLVRLLAIFLVFAVVRNNLATPAVFRRLSVAVVINGTLLAFFALVQFFSSTPNMVYWTYPSLGSVFGPFINKNHFPYYVNCSIGLGFGLLWSRRWSLLNQGTEEPAEARANLGRSRRPPRPSTAASKPDWVSSWLSILQDPVSLWICAGLASWSAAWRFRFRGGMLGLVGAFCCCLLLKILQDKSLARAIGTVTCLVLGAGLASWIGMARIEARLSTLWGGTAIEGRWPMWVEAASIVKDFPIWGTGYGAYEVVNPIYRAPGSYVGVNVDHAHNEYLEVLVEGGVPALLLVLLAVGCICWLGWRAVRYRSRPTAGLALGGLFALIAVLIHNVGEFGLHIPANMLLITVISAHLCGLGSRAQPSERAEFPNNSADAHAIRFGRLPSAMAALGALGLAAVVCLAGWRGHQIESLRQAAFRTGKTRDAAKLLQKIALLESACRLAPGHAGLHNEAGNAYLNLFGARQAESGLRNKLCEATAIVLLPSFSTVSCGAINPAPAALPCGFEASASGRGLAYQADLLLDRQGLAPALRHYLRGRNSCPVLPNPQLALALFMPRQELREVYKTRVKLLGPADPTSWYFCGLQEQTDGHLDQACQSWRQSLDISNLHLADILDRCAKLLGPERLANEVLPDRVGILLDAARRLYAPEDDESRRPILEKAVAVLNTQTEPLTVADLKIKIDLHRRLGQATAALKAYRAPEPGAPRGRLEDGPGPASL